MVKDTGRSSTVGEEKSELSGKSLNKMNKIFRAAVRRDANVDARSKNQRQTNDENTQEDRHREQVKSDNSRGVKPSRLRSDSGQRLLREIEVMSSSEEDIKRSKARRRFKLTRSVESFERSLDTNERTSNLTKEKERNKGNTIIDMASLESNENCEISVHDEKSLRGNRHVKSVVVEVEPDTRRPFFKQSWESSKSVSRSNHGLGRSEKVMSTDIEMSSLKSEMQKPIDVVVDIHYENEDERSTFRETSVDRSSIENDPEDSTKRLKVTKAGKSMFSKRNVGESNGKLRKSLTNQGLKNVMDNFIAQDSFDLIEEFNQASESSRSTIGERLNEERVRLVDTSKTDPSARADWSKESGGNILDTPNGTRNLESEDLVIRTPIKIEEQIIGEVQRRARKKWSCATDESNFVEDLKKTQRKRWSKDANVPFSKARNENTWSTGSARKKSLDRDSEGPVPAPRSKISSKRAETRVGSFLEFDNDAFESDHEDILRIETDYRESTKIELHKLAGRSDDSEDKISDKSVGRTGGTSVLTIESNLSETSDESETRIMAGDLNVGKSFVDQGNIRNTVLEIESSEESYVDDDSRVENAVSLSSIEDRSRLSKIHRKRQFLNEDNLINNTMVSRSTDDIYEKDSELDATSSAGTIVRRSRKSSLVRAESIYSQKGSSQDSIISASDSSDKSRRRHRRHIEDSTTTKKKKKKRKEKAGKKKSKKNPKSGGNSSAQDQNVIEEETKIDEKYISITIHRSEMLETDYMTRHPMVKVHIVNADTGNYPKTKENDRDGRKCKYLQPVITGKFDFREKKSVVPIWEEELIFEHDFETIVKTGSDQTLIFFEIVDLLSFAEASESYSQFGSDGCWHKIAWAFLKPVGINGTMHVDKQIRLQLYRPMKTTKKIDRHKCEVYGWWKSSYREKYPSSLFVTVTSVEPPKLEPVFYGQLSLNDLSDRSMQNDSQKASIRTSDSIRLPKWTRLSAQSCKIPNENLFETETSERGCFYIAFSNDGKYLACVNAEEYDYPIVVYAIDEKKIHVRFSGHRNFVYTLNWSNDDYYLLSVSSDQTACLWDVRNKIVQCVQMLPHPSYVYCGKFDPGNTLIVATGCFDHAARIWAKNKRSKDYQLIQELEIHEGFVNSLCFQRDGSLLTADSVGVIVLWSVRKNRKAPAKKEWQVSRKIKIREIENVTINTIVLHPLGSRLLVHSRNNGLRMLDLATGVVLQLYEGSKNQRIQTTACISPCGGLVLCGGEDSSLNIWNLENGTHLARYTTNHNARNVACVDYHPYDHVLAFSIFGISTTVRVLKFDKNSTGEGVGLKLLVEAENEVHSTSEIAVNFQDDSSRTNERLNLSTGSRNWLLESPSSSRKKEDRRSSRSLRVTTSRRSTEVVHEDERDEEERRDNLRLKLQKMTESEQSLKTRSTNRLINIIEKIDRILSNTSRSDRELTRSPNGFCDDAARILSDGDNNFNRLTKRKTKFGKYLNFDGNSMSNVDSVQTESFELRNILGKENQVRSGSAKETRVFRIVDEDLPKTFSDGAVKPDGDLELFEDSLGSDALRKEEFKRAGFDDGLIFKQSRLNCSSGSMRGDEPDVDRAFMSESDGTCVVEKSELERNNDLDFGRIVDSDSSIRSNVTFVIENERPVPKPRRKSGKVRINSSDLCQ